MTTKLQYFLLALCFLWASHQTVQAQHSSPVDAGARGLSMASTGVVFSDINSAFTNQAGLAFLDKTSFSIFGAQRYLVQGLNNFGFAAAMPIRKIGTIGLSISHFGHSAYHAQKIGLSYSRLLAPNFALAVQFDYLATSIPDYGIAHNFTGEIGIMYKASKQVTFGAHVYNPFAVKLKSGDAMATLFKVGIGYHPSEKVNLVGEIEKDLLYPLAAKFGIEYMPIKALAVRAGMASGPFRASFGVGVKWQGLLIDFGTSYHEILGFTPAISLSYAFDKKA